MMMLLIGMKTSLTVYPMRPMMANPTAQLVAIFLNSFASGFVHLWSSRLELAANSCASFTYSICLPLLTLTQLDSS